MQNEGTISRIAYIDETEVRASRYITGVYLYMMAGVALSAFVAYALLVSGLLRQCIVIGGRGFFWGVFGVQLATLLWFGPISRRASSTAALSLYMFYAAITGTTLGVASLIYTASSFLNVFLMASLAFGGIAAYGHWTKKNLSVFGTFCMQALVMLFFGSLIYAVASMIPALGGFIPAFDVPLSIIGVAVFSGLTAYESQKLKDIAYELAQSSASDETVSKYKIHGALNMYLNFINIFLNLLRLFGRRK